MLSSPFNLFALLFTIIIITLVVIACGHAIAPYQQYHVHFIVHIYSVIVLYLTTYFLLTIYYYHRK